MSRRAVGYAVGLAWAIIASAMGPVVAQPIRFEVGEAVHTQIRNDAFGIQYHRNTYSAADALAKLDVLPLTSVRLWAYPSEFHPEPGVWDWTELDAQIAEVTAAGYTPWVCLFQAEDWYTGTQETPWWNDADARAEWVVTAQALAARYADTVDRWIVFDEINYLHSDRSYYMPLTTSVDLYLAAAEAIRTEDPEAEIGGPSGFAGWENGYWAQRVLAAPDGSRQLDFISSNLFLSWNAADTDEQIMDRTIWYEEAPLRIREMAGEEPTLVLDAYNASALWTRDGTPTGELWTDPRNVNTFGGVYQAAALLHALKGGFDVTLRWETLGGFGILRWYPGFEKRAPYYAWQMVVEAGRLMPGSELVEIQTTEAPREGMPHHSGQNVAGYRVQPFALRDAEGLSVVLLNKYVEAKSVELAVPYSTGEAELYRFDADRHASSVDPLREIGSVRGGELLPLDLPGLSVTVLRFGASQPTAIEDAARSDSPARLQAIAPNPIRQTGEVRVELAQPLEITLEVLTADGRQVASLVSSWRSHGLHTIPFDASGLSAGTYFARLCAAGACTSRPLTVAR
ncbi:MAG: hypothetical protein AAF170_11265 [Bacteroidota bacterium]